MDNFCNVILEENGFLHLEEPADILAGSSLQLYQGIQFAARSGVCSLGEAIRMATLHPARLFHLDVDGAGKLMQGSPGDLIMYRWGEDQVFDIQRTVAGGVVVYEGEAQRN